MVKAAFAGVRSAVVALILMAAIKVGKKSIKDRYSALITITTIILVLVFNLHAIFAIIGGASIGLMIYFTSAKNKSDIPEEGRDEN